MFLCSNALSLCGIALIPLASSGLRARLCVQQQNLCTRHTTGTKCEEKEKERMVFDPFGQKSTSEKRKTQEKEKKKEEKKPKKKRKKAKRVVQTPSPSLEKGRLSPFQFYFFINNYTCVCLLCLRERERESQIRAAFVEDTRARLPQQQRIDRSRNTRYIAHRYLFFS